MAVYVHQQALFLYLHGQDMEVIRRQWERRPEDEVVARFPVCRCVVPPYVQAVLPDDDFVVFQRPQYARGVGFVLHRKHKHGRAQRLEAAADGDFCPGVVVSGGQETHIVKVVGIVRYLAVGDAVSFLPEAGQGFKAPGIGIFQTGVLPSAGDKRDKHTMASFG